MSIRSFAERLQESMARSNSLLCVGLDPDMSRLPLHLRDQAPGEAILRFNAALIAATSDLVCAYKPNLGFYLRYGIAGIEALIATRRMVPTGIPVILDAKWGDIGSTAEAYAEAGFVTWGFDALTVNPYLGSDSVHPFLDYPGHGIFVLCKTSNPGSGDFQDRQLRDGETVAPLYASVARRAREWQRGAATTIGLVAGATHPAALREIRLICPDAPILIPGAGAQGGDLKRALAGALTADGLGGLISSSRSVIYAGMGEDFDSRARESALALRNAINLERPAAIGIGAG